MGLLSTLKEFFSKKSIESLKEFETELIKLQKKSNSEIIALMGTGGRLKGLPLIYVANEEADLKRYAARIAELIGPLNNLSNEQSIKDVIIRFETSYLFYIPLLKNVSFFAITPHKHDLLSLQQWVTNNNSIIQELFREKT
ncbi:MAG TPA: hypothetical protein VMV49_00300 [Candidatus Deferrimicrobium sp.]|nr:hypothetical protein [Candidatus Deferrimicrobium sp.]